MRKLTVTHFDLRNTVLSGQLFRFDEAGPELVLRAGSRIMRLRQEGQTLEYEGCPAAFLRQFFDLGFDLEPVLEELRQDRYLAQAIAAFPGIRIVRQELWECLVSFVCSSASNIPRIRKNIHALCRLYGQPICLNGFASYSFPRPGDLGSEREMRRSGLGYRARYLNEINRQICPEYLARLRQADFHEARGSLLELPGVGEKVADCVLLFALGFGQAFPVDVWIQRIMEECYFGSRKTPARDIRAFAQDKFGPFAGYAQQYLFHYARMRDRTDG